MQLHRSGLLGPAVVSWCDRGEMAQASPKAGDDVSRAVAAVLRSRDGQLVRRNRVDVELVEVARSLRGAVLTGERGLTRLSDRRGVPCLDLLALFAWARRLGLLSPDETEEATAPWHGRAADGTGAPPDLRDTFAATAEARQGLAGLLEALR